MRSGFYIENLRWLLAGLALTFFSSFGQTYFISLFAGDLRAYHGLSDGGWGTLYTAATLASAAALFRFGALVDTVRPDRLAAALLLVYAAVAAGMAMAGSVALLGLLVFGLRFCGQGMMSHLAITSMGRWFRGHRGRAVAFAGLGFSIGEAVLPALGVLTIAALGWRGAWVAVALFLALVAAPLMVLLLARGRTPQGQASQEAAPGLEGRHWTRPEVLRHWVFWALLPILFSSPFIGTVLFFHQVHISQTMGWDLVQMALGFPLFAGMTVAAGLLGGWLADRLGPGRLLAAVPLPMAASMAVLASGTGVWAWFAALGLIGLTQGLSQALWGALWPELYGTRHLGAVRAMSATGMVFATAAGPGITGLLIDAGIDYPAQAPFFAAWSLAVSGLAYGVMRAVRSESPRP